MTSEFTSFSKAHMLHAFFACVWFNTYKRSCSIGAKLKFRTKMVQHSTGMYSCSNISWLHLTARLLNEGAAASEF